MKNLECFLNSNVDLKPLNDDELTSHDGGLILTGIYGWMTDTVSSGAAFVKGLSDGWDKAMLDHN